MQQRVLVFILFSIFVVGLGGCGAGRTAAATQKTPAAFDPSMSDQEALTAVDAMSATLGGAEAWAQVKQIRWDVKYHMQGQLRGWFRHAWDIWNGRHRYEFTPADQLAATEPVFTFAMYDLFDRGDGWVATTKSPSQNAPAEERGRIIQNAYESWQRDAYQLAIFYKLRDPGVKLTYAGERQDFAGVCESGCIDVKITFMPEVGSDTYHVLINKETKLPEAIEKAVPNGTLGFKVEGWATVNGMKFPSVLQNLGTDEKFVFENIRIGEPEDELYVPQVHG